MRSKLSTPLRDGPLFEPGEDASSVNWLRHTMIPGAIALDGCLSYLAKMSPDRAPQNDGDWMAFATTLVGCAKPIYNALDISRTPILEASKANWENWRETLACAADFTPQEFGRREITLGTIDALEALDDFNRTMIMPLVLRSIESTGQPIPSQTPEYLMADFVAAGEIVAGKSKAVAVSRLERIRRDPSYQAAGGGAGRQMPAMKPDQGRGGEGRGNALQLPPRYSVTKLRMFEASTHSTKSTHKTIQHILTPLHKKLFLITSREFRSRINTKS